MSVHGEMTFGKDPRKEGKHREHGSKLQGRSPLNLLSLRVLGEIQVGSRKSIKNMEFRKQVWVEFEIEMCSCQQRGDN